MTTLYEADDISYELATMDFSHGILIPSNWEKNIKFPNGKVDHSACRILAEIVYWYRPVSLKDINTAETSLHRKYKSDLLQKSYEQLEASTGYTKRECREAIVRLEGMGLIERVFRTIDANGFKISNVLYIKIFTKNIKEITDFKKCDSYDVQTSDPCDVSMSDPMTFKRHTNTETTNTKITKYREREGMRPSHAHSISQNEEQIKTEELIDPQNLPSSTLQHNIHYQDIISERDSNKIIKKQEFNKQELSKCKNEKISISKNERAPLVFVSDEEHEELLGKLGTKGLNKAYIRLSEWKKDTDKSKWKKSDYRSILRWVVDAVKEDLQKEKIKPISVSPDFHLIEVRRKQLNYLILQKLDLIRSKDIDVSDHVTHVRINRIHIQYDDENYEKKLSKALKEQGL